MLDYNRLAADYARHRAVNPKALAALIDGAEIGSSSRVLEIGCGTGNYIGAIRQATGAECWGIDPSVEMLTTAADRHPELIVDIGSAEEIPFAAGQFDLVYSVDVIHHVDDLPAAFGEAKRATEAGRAYLHGHRFDRCDPPSQTAVELFPGNRRRRGSPLSRPSHIWPI